VITRFTVENFKRLGSAELDLGAASVFIGPNNSGKTTALQALALWDLGWRRWAEKRDNSTASKRTGVTINRRDLSAIPVPSARLLWNNLHTHSTRPREGKSKTEKTFIVLSAEGIHLGEPWRCALEFYYANEESFYCRLTGDESAQVPEGARAHKVVFLPPMSGLAEREYRKEPGEIKVLIGEGQTAQVLRNLCWQLFQSNDGAQWQRLVEHVASLFHVRLQEPVYIRERSELVLTYREEPSGVELDLSSAGCGCQQVILLLSYMLANPGAVLLLDEPDAHLEILRQRDIYNLITQIANESGAQIIAASHSEVVLQEAAERDVVVAFVGRPHRIDTRSRGQVKKALESIRMADYFLAEQKGWMLYLEGSTDLAILGRLAARLGHPASKYLTDGVPVYYLGHNQPQEARDHFQGLREAKNDLVGFALFDRLDRALHAGSQLTERMWSRREIENYLVTPESVRAFVSGSLNQEDLIESAERSKRIEVLNREVATLEQALRVTGQPEPWGSEIKVTDHFLDPLFKNYYSALGIPQAVFKRDYHGLADAIPIEQIDQEVLQVLDAIVEVAERARPAGRASE
jgi:predicted ATPase